MYFKISGTKRGKKTFTCDGYFNISWRRTNKKCKYRIRTQCHVNNISINLEHNDEQDEKKLKDNNY